MQNEKLHQICGTATRTSHPRLSRQRPLAGRPRGFECGIRTTKSIHSISPHEGTRSETMIISSWILSSIVPQKPNLSPTLEASRRSAKTATSRAEAHAHDVHTWARGSGGVLWFDERAVRTAETSEQNARDDDNERVKETAAPHLERYDQRRVRCVRAAGVRDGVRFA